MKKCLCAANWKMNKNPKETVTYFKNFLNAISKEEEEDFIFFPPTLCLTQTAYNLKNTNVGWGIQNAYTEKSGPYTGENSPKTIAELNATHVLVGHSERRVLFGLSDEDIAKTVKIVHNLDMTPLICIGELGIQRDEGKTIDVTTDQIKKALCFADLTKDIIVAYEPVWSIGTGQSATAKMAEEVHIAIREVLAEILKDGKKSQATPILYGGSVNPSNAKELFEEPNIDGFLVGKASLEVDSFYSVYKNACSQDPDETTSQKKEAKP